jgi:hypothetical protein
MLLSIKPVKHYRYLNKIKKSSCYITRNILHFHYRDQSVDVFENLSIILCLSVYGSTALCRASAAPAGFLGCEISPSQARYLHRSAQTE